MDTLDFWGNNLTIQHLQHAITICATQGVRVVDFCPTVPIDARHNWAAERAAHECRIYGGKLGSGGANSRTVFLIFSKDKPKMRTAAKLIKIEIRIRVPGPFY